MTVKDSATLKSYFNLTNVLTPSNYVDLVDTIFAQGVGGIGGEHDHDDRYVQLSIANTISAVHIFNPSVYSPPFIIGSSAQGQTVIGLKADQLNKSISVSGLGLSGGGALTDNRTITLTSSSNPNNTASILASDSSGYLSLLRLNVDILADRSGSNLTLFPAGNIILDPTGADVLPFLGYEINLGSLQKKYLTLHAAELWVETLVAADTIATIGGRILVGPTTVLTTADLGSTQTNMVLNPGFETAGAGGADVFANWTETAGNGAITRDSVDKHTGTYSLKITCGVGLNTWIEQPITVVAGRGYSLEFWTRGDGSANQGRYGIWDYTHSAWIAPYNLPTGVTATTPWVRVRNYFVAPVGTTSIGVVFYPPQVNTAFAQFDDVALYCDTIIVKHNEMAGGDVVYMEANGQYEAMLVLSGPTGSAPAFTYWVYRDWDGSGLTAWYMGDAVFNTGTTTEGFIDLYSVHGIKSQTQYGPTIVGNIRNSLSSFDYSEAWAVGNLKGLYGYGSNTYGFAAGKYADDKSFITADATNGFRIISRSGGLDTVRAKWDVLGNILIGRATLSESNIYITAGLLSIRNNLIERIGLSSAGILTIKDGAGNPVFTFNSSTGAEFTLPLTLASGGGIYQGTTGTFQSPGTGLKIWNESNVGRIAGYNAGVLQWGAGTDGILYAGAGEVKLSSNGIAITAGGGTLYTKNTISWYIGSTQAFYIDAQDYYPGDSTVTANIRMNQLSGRDNAVLAIRNDLASGKSGSIQIGVTNNGAASTNITFQNNGIITYSGNNTFYGDARIGGGLYIGATNQDPAAGTLTVTNIVSILQGGRLIFPHANQIDSSDGNIASGFHAEGLNIVGTQTVGGNGRKIQFWGDIIHNGSIRSSTALGCTAYHNAAQSIQTAVLTYLSFNSEYWDTDAIHDTSTYNNRLTCKTAGVYLIIGQVRWAANATGQRQVNITLSSGRSVIAAQHEHGNSASIATNMSVSCIYPLAVNDYVELAVYQDSGGNLDITATAYWSPNFQMVRIA